MMRNPDIGSNLRTQIVDYEAKGFIRRLSAREAAESTKKTRYLPLFAVINPNKPSKVRMVWDAAAVSNGTSLNENLLSGPDLLTPITNVLYRFRQFSFAVSADIEQMFHQVLVDPEDRHSQRFLWQDHPKSERQTYEMQVMTFGATCSPSTAQYVKNLNAERFRAVDEILRNHYVDDYLASHKSEEESLSK